MGDSAISVVLGMNVDRLFNKSTVLVAWTVDVCSEVSTEIVVSTVVVCANDEIDVERIGVKVDAGLVVSEPIVVVNGAVLSNAD